MHEARRWHGQCPRPHHVPHAPANTGHRCRPRPLHVALCLPVSPLILYIVLPFCTGNSRITRSLSVSPVARYWSTWRRNALAAPDRGGKVSRCSSTRLCRLNSQASLLDPMEELMAHIKQMAAADGSRSRAQKVTDASPHASDRTAAAVRAEGAQGSVARSGKYGGHQGQTR